MNLELDSVMKSVSCLSSQPKVKKAGKQKAKVVHPNSRKAAQLVREAHRKEKLERWVGLRVVAGWLVGLRVA